MTAKKAPAKHGKAATTRRKKPPVAKAWDGKPEDKPLDAKEKVFVREYLAHREVQRAALKAGYSETMASSKCYQWVRDSKIKPHVYAAIRAGEAKLAERAEITQEMVLARYWEIANANPNEIIEHRRVCCRYCFGDGHAYQWKDEAEYLSAVRAAERDDLEPPTDEGGYGFDRTLRPHPKCPKCDGEGHGTVHAHDTRDLGPGAMALYAGVKVTKDGFEIKVHDQLAALEKVARHLGMFNEKLMLQSDPDDPLVQLLQRLSGKTISPGEDQ